MPKLTLRFNTSHVIKDQRLVLHGQPGRAPVPRDLRDLKQTARAILPSDSLSLRMIESQEDIMPDDRARVVVPILARMLREEFRERPTAS